MTTKTEPSEMASYRMKPLEWTDYPDDGKSFVVASAVTIFGRLEIRRWQLSERHSYGFVSEKWGRQAAGSLAAEKHYRERLLAALEPAAQPLPEELEDIQARAEAATPVGMSELPSLEELEAEKAAAHAALDAGGVAREKPGDPEAAKELQHITAKVTSHGSETTAGSSLAQLKEAAAPAPLSLAARVALLLEERDELRTDLDAIKDDNETLILSEARLKAERNARQRTVEVLSTENVNLRAGHPPFADSVHESELATLRTEIERLTTERDTSFHEGVQTGDKALAEFGEQMRGLVAERELLGECRHFLDKGVAVRCMSQWPVLRELLPPLLDKLSAALQPAQKHEEIAAALREAIAMCDEAYDATGYIKVATSSHQRLRLEAAIELLAAERGLEDGASECISLDGPLPSKAGQYLRQRADDPKAQAELAYVMWIDCGQQWLSQYRWSKRLTLLTPPMGEKP